MSPTPLRRDVAEQVIGERRAPHVAQRDGEADLSRQDVSSCLQVAGVEKRRSDLLKRHRDACGIVEPPLDLKAGLVLGHGGPIVARLLP